MKPPEEEKPAVEVSVLEEGKDLIDLGDVDSSEVIETSQTLNQAEETKTGILIETIEEEDSLSMDGINVKVCLLTLWYKGTYVLGHQKRLDHNHTHLLIHLQTITKLLLPFREVLNILACS